MIDHISNHLYLSGAGPVLSEKGRLKIQELEIKHIVTVSAMAIPVEKRISNIQYTFFFAMDLNDHDILSILDEAVMLIEHAIKEKENVLVHCEAGMSRSVCLVAAYLMKKYKWNTEKALTYIQKIRPIAQPNEGFIEQLNTFEKLGYCATHENLESSQQYRLLRNKIGNSSNTHQANATSSKDSHSQMEKDPNQNKYRCGKCRKVVFYEEHLMKHNRSDGQACTLSYLVEPMKWMPVEEYQGKISCPSCNEKLGNYSWGGRPCLGEGGYPCKHLVTPWVHLHKSKIDVVKSGQQSFVSPVIPTVVIS